LRVQPWNSCASSKNSSLSVVSGVVCVGLLIDVPICYSIGCTPSTIWFVKEVI
jgi:hypothetical protein